MTRPVPCLPYAMEREVTRLARSGYTIHSARGDTGFIMTSFYGAAIIFHFDGKEIRKLSCEEAIEVAKRYES